MNPELSRASPMINVWHILPFILFKVLKMMHETLFSGFPYKLTGIGSRFASSHYPHYITGKVYHASCVALPSFNKLV
jgi:hypothetical protein